jgi:hypothetical protein
VVLFFYRLWLETKIVLKALTHQRRGNRFAETTKRERRRTMSAAEEEEDCKAEQRFLAERYQSRLPWVCALWRWRWCCCVRGSGAVETAEMTRTISSVRGALVDHDEVFDELCEEIGRKTHAEINALNADEVWMVMKKLYRSNTKHECVLGVQEFAKEQRGYLNNKEFSKFYAKLTRHSYIASKWNWVKLFVMFCHAWCVWLLIDTKAARMKDGSLLGLVHPHHSSGWKFSERTWSGNDFDDTNADPIKDFTNISVIGRDCDWLRYLSSVMMIGQALLCLQYFVHIDPRLAIITESIRIVGDELVHFAGVFTFSLMMYALAGHTM